MKNVKIITRVLFVCFCFIESAVIGQTLNESQGTGAGINITTGDYNTIYGDSSGFTLTSGSRNVILGFGAGKSLITSESVFIGYRAGYRNTSGFDNIFIGHESGKNNLTGGDNTFIGTEAGEANTTGYDNTFIGEESGTSNSTGYENTFIGEDAGFLNTTGYRNTFVGNEAGISSGTGYRNTAVGSEAMSDVSTGHHNTALGDSAGIDVNAGLWNTFVGAASGPSTEHADYNTFIGAMAGFENNRTNSLTNANRNTYVGFRTGYTNREGEDNVGMGAYANFDDVIRSRCTFIGAGALPGINDATMLGYKTRVEGQFGIAMGVNAEAWSISSIALGYLSNIAVNSDYSIGIGGNIDIDNKYAIAIGESASVKADSSMVFGLNASATGSKSVVVGNNASTAQSNSFVIGGAGEDRLSVGIGTDAPNLNASLDLSESDKGFLISRMTTSERTTFEATLAASEEGMLVFDKDLDMLYSWDGSSWISPGGSNFQSLALTDDTLEISDGNYVVLENYLDNTDDQSLEGRIDGDTLTIDIENGSSAVVDLSSLLTDIKAKLDKQEEKIALIDEINEIVAAQAEQIAKMEEDIALLKTISTTELGMDTSLPGISIGQSTPNPANGRISISFNIPNEVRDAQIRVYDLKGILHMNIPIHSRGKNSIEISKGELNPGQYLYTLIAEGAKVDTKKMIVQ